MNEDQFQKDLDNITVETCRCYFEDWEGDHDLTKDQRRTLYGKLKGILDVLIAE